MTTPTTTRAGNGTPHLDGDVTKALLRTRRFLQPTAVSADLRTLHQTGVRAPRLPAGRRVPCSLSGIDRRAAHPRRVALWPFTQLVHVFSVPVGYLWRP